MMRPQLHGWIGCTLLTLPLPARAAESTFLGAGFQALLGLGIVLALIAGASIVLKRMIPGRLGRPGLLKNIATVAVGPRERIVVVEIGATWMVVGVTANQITALHVMEKGTFPSTPDPAANTATAADPTVFGKLLSRFQER